MSDLNKNDKNLNLIRLALTAGLYPKVSYINRFGVPRERLVTNGDLFLSISRKSTLNTTLYFSKKKRSDCLLSEWLLYVEKMSHNHNICHADHLTLVSNLMVALQCGKRAKLEKIEIFNPLEGEEYMYDDDMSYLCLDSWIRIKMDTKLGQKLLKMRENMANEFDELVSSRHVIPSRCHSPNYLKQMLELNTDDSGLSAFDNSLNFEVWAQN